MQVSILNKGKRKFLKYLNCLQSIGLVDTVLGTVCAQSRCNLPQRSRKTSVQKQARKEASPPPDRAPVCGTDGSFGAEY